MRQGLREETREMRSWDQKELLIEILYINKKIELKIPSNQRVLTRQERLNSGGCMHKKYQSVWEIIIGYLIKIIIKN